MECIFVPYFKMGDLGSIWIIDGGNSELLLFPMLDLLEEEESLLDELGTEFRWWLLEVVIRPLPDCLRLRLLLPRVEDFRERGWV